MGELSDHVARNRARWDQWAHEYEEPGQRNWPSDEPGWGIWGVPEAQLGMHPADVAGLDVIELGCGTAYVSAWLARRGARPVAIDNSTAQLETARRFQREFRLLHGNAEQVPLPDQSFDLAMSEQGASIWCDPLSVDSGGSETAAPRRQAPTPYFGIHPFKWPDDDSVEFHLPHGEMIRLLRRSGFDVEELIESRPPDGSTTRYSFVTHTRIGAELAMRRGLESPQDQLSAAGDHPTSATPSHRATRPPFATRQAPWPRPSYARLARKAIDSLMPCPTYAGRAGTPTYTRPTRVIAIA